MATAVALALYATPTCAVTNGAAVPSSDTRLDGVAAFSVSWRLGFDHGSHADDADHDWFCAATLIAPDTIVTAAHCLQAYGLSATYMVRFRRQTNGSVGTIEDGVASFFHARVDPAGWIQYLAQDVAVGKLLTSVTHIGPVALHQDAPQEGSVIFQAAWGKEGPAYQQGPRTQLRTCQNELWLWDKTALQLYAWTPYGDDAWPCGLNSNDSGGAVLIEKPALPVPQLRLIGVATGLSPAASVLLLQ